MMRAAVGDVWHARNAIFEHWLTKTEAKYLLFLDSDMTFTPDLPERLMAASRENPGAVIGGLCFALRQRGAPNALRGIEHDVIPTVYDLVKTGTDGEVGFTPRTELPDSGLMECSATGGAALLIPRDVGRILREELVEGEEEGPFDCLRIPGAGAAGAVQHFSEDLSFCLRVNRAGMRVLVNVDAETGHIKGPFTLTRKDWEAACSRPKPA